MLAVFKLCLVFCLFVYFGVCFQPPFNKEKKGIVPSGHKFEIKHAFQKQKRKKIDRLGEISHKLESLGLEFYVLWGKQKNKK